MSQAIEQAIVDLSEQNGVVGNIAKELDRIDHDDVRIRITTAFRDAYREQQLNYAADDLDNGKRAEEQAIKPGHFLTFMQRLANRVTGNSMAAYIAAERQALLDDQEANGISFDDDILEEKGFETSDSMRSIEAEHAECFMDLLKVQTYLEKFFRGKPVDPLVMFEYSTPDEDGNWHRIAEAETWEECFTAREAMITYLREKTEEELSLESMESFFEAA